MRKGTSTLFIVSVANTLLLLTSLVLPLPNLLLQPVHAQTTNMTFKTPKPATYTDPDTGQAFTLSFDAQGTTTPSGPQAAKITNGTIHTPNFNGQGSQSLTGSITVELIPLGANHQAFSFTLQYKMLFIL